MNQTLTIILKVMPIKNLSYYLEFRLHISRDISHSCFFLKIEWIEAQTRQRSQDRR